jgi:hypothetical protein
VFHLRWGVLDTTLCDKVCQWLATGWWFSAVSFTNKTDRNQGRIQDFKLGGWGRTYKNCAERRETRKCVGYFVWKITILRQKIIFFPILGVRPPPANGITEILLKAALNIITSLSLDIIVLSKRKHYLKFTYIQNFFSILCTQTMENIRRM